MNVNVQLLGIGQVQAKSFHHIVQQKREKREGGNADGRECGEKWLNESAHTYKFLSRSEIRIRPPFGFRLRLP